MKLIERKKTDRKFENISFRCTTEQAEQLRKLAKDYNTTVTDILIQMLTLATKGWKATGELK